MKHADVNVIFDFDEWKQQINTNADAIAFGAAELYFPEFLQNHAWFMTAPVAAHDGMTLAAKSIKSSIQAQSPESDEYIEIKLAALVDSMISQVLKSAEVSGEKVFVYCIVINKIQQSATFRFAFQ